MSSDKHPKLDLDQKPRDDLKNNPGIGASKGGFATGAEPEEILADNTVEGDVANATRDGAADPRQMPRGNR